MWRRSWLDDSYRRERDEHDVCAICRQHYERGQTAWDISLDPEQFDITLKGRRRGQAGAFGRDGFSAVVTSGIACSVHC
jgi:hypothetical protein